jgi:hypothetical protein
LCSFLIANRLQYIQRMAGGKFNPAQWRFRKQAFHSGAGCPRYRVISREMDIIGPAKNRIRLHNS